GSGRSGKMSARPARVATKSNGLRRLSARKRIMPMRKRTEPWRPALLRWKQSLPACVRRLLRRQWLAKALRLAERGEEMIARGRAYTSAARQIEPTDHHHQGDINDQP